MKGFLRSMGVYAVVVTVCAAVAAFGVIVGHSALAGTFGFLALFSLQFAQMRVLDERCSMASERLDVLDERIVDLNAALDDLEEGDR